MKTHDPASKATEKDYDITDIERLVGKQQWKSYDEMIKWLKEQGDEDRRFTPGEVRHMIDDFTRLKQSKTSFITDAQQLYDKLKSSR